jgi:hypothetical protein
MRRKIPHQAMGVSARVSLWHDPMGRRRFGAALCHSAYLVGSTSRLADLNATRWVLLSNPEFKCPSTEGENDESRNHVVDAIATGPISGKDFPDAS